MEDPRITAEQILGAIDIDMRQLAQTVADAINNAEDGAIINQSEEPVRDAHALFRQVTFQKALSLLETRQQAFSPSPDPERDKVE
jgi:hypothetical protein